jgi:hypothetical protein
MIERLLTERQQQLFKHTLVELQDSTLKIVASWAAGGPDCMAASVTRIGHYSWK